MTERQILFSGPMIRAILSGSKSQTRRVVKEPSWATPHTLHLFNGAPWASDPLRGDRDVPCPYGQPGTKLWVREAWMPDPPNDGTWEYTAWAGERIGQIAAVPARFRHPAFCNYAADWLHGAVRWTPSIHMPRWASRITLEVTGVRVERLGEISESDAWAEGVQSVSEFKELWASINGTWEPKQWIWVLQFQRV